jgi:long-chain acyl-CoA synthetase
LPLGVIRYGAAAGGSPRFEELLLRDSISLELPAPKPADPAIIFFTSGSTGLPKGVTHSFETVGWILASVIKGCEMTPDDVILPASSASHIGAFTFSFAMLAAGGRVSRKDFASLRLCMSGGDKVPAELEREFTDLVGFLIDEIYGMSEIGIATVNPPSGVNKIGSIGRLNPGYELSMRDENGTEVSTDAEGRLWIKSRCNMVGYWDNPAATEATFRDGWLDTGDLMSIDADGYLWFRGRKKQIIVHDGSNICPQEVEGALVEHPAVASAGVIGVHALVHGENVRAYVTLMQGASRPTSQELIRFARARVGYKAPEEIVVLDEMPLNATGKMDRVALKRMAEARLGGEAPS